MSQTFIMRKTYICNTNAVIFYYQKFVNFNLNSLLNFKNIFIWMAKKTLAMGLIKLFKSF
jgi:hypothetical protein